ncbi:MAG: hypothetical protein ACRDRZ_16645 [Pseudonocardiaceae bacterium]
MPAPDSRAPDPAVLAEVIAERILEHPAVAALHGGPFGTVASYLPGRRVVGVLVDGTDGSVQLSVVLRPVAPLPQVIADLRRRVAAVAGPVPVDVTVADLSTSDEDETVTG